MAGVLEAIQTILGGEEGQITIRHLFYRLVGERVIEKTEPAYKGLCAHLAKWRRSQDIEWSAFADNTRWHIRHETFDGIEEALRNTAQTYRRNLWSTQPYFVEVWVEKDAIASIVSRAANSFGVPVFVAFRDDFNVEVEFIRAAVTQEQIQRLDLPTRPVKTSDGRAAKWTGGECVELDSMPPAEIRALVEQSITRHIDSRQWEMLQQTEAGEREQLKKIWRTAA